MTFNFMSACRNMTYSRKELILMIEKPLQRHGGRLEHNETYCGSCYGAEASDNDCCNSCEDVREAYRKKGWAISNPDMIDQTASFRGAQDHLKHNAQPRCYSLVNTVVLSIIGLSCLWSLRFSESKLPQDEGIDEGFLNGALHHAFSHYQEMAAAQRAARLDLSSKEVNMVVRRTRAVAMARSNGNDLATYRSKLGQFEKAIKDWTAALNPENLLLDSFGVLKVSDFGLSAFSQQVREDVLFHTACGTPNYVAPEVIDQLLNFMNLLVFRSNSQGKGSNLLPWARSHLTIVALRRYKDYYATNRPLS
ncbi:hypothetical protein TEA_000206 [Camellia sinensis var. sinensis]|uniref:Protein kinase domain-containing protein n=1 Tax=Camellia sinensis var. sinensis TaxID=542762 RepID=A0A4S4DDI3_CAMSN|nr:hypothetical protein TEA_000206 [Camellia sinensis var. sinensis]